MSVARGLIAECRRRDLTTLLLGTTWQRPAGDADDPAQYDVPLRRRPILWRVPSWHLAGQLARHLRHLPPPRHAFVAQSMHWVVAARRAWPNARIIYVYPCLLSHCLPCTWSPHRAPSLWQRADLAGIRHAEHLALAAADLVLLPSRASWREAQAFHPTATQRLALCHFTCPSADADPAERRRQRHALAVPDDGLLALAVGVCDHNKSFDWLLREWTHLDGREHVVIVGDGPEFAALAAQAEAAGLSERVHFVGGHPHIGPFYAAADCIVSTSLYENFGLTLLEGMARGRPAIVPRHNPPAVRAGFAEVITAEGGGLVYDREQPGALAAAIRRLSQEPGLLAILGDQARTLASHRSSWADCLNQILGLDEPTTPADNACPTQLVESTPV